MKRLIALLCVLAMFLSIPVYAAETTPVISADRVTAKAGETIDVPIRITGNTGILGAKITVQYDEKLTLTAVTAGEAFSDLVMTKPGKLTDNPVSIVWDGIDAQATAYGVIATLTFKAPEQDGTYAIGLTYKASDIVDGDLKRVALTMNAGSITVSAQCDHTVVADAAVAPTCTQPGKTAGTHCSTCGAVLQTQTEIPALGHNYVDGMCTRCRAADMKTLPADAARFVVSQVTGHAGEEVAVEVSMVNNPGIVAAYLNISYDRTKLKLTGVTNGTVMTDSSFSPTYDVSPYCLNWDESTKEGNNTNNGLLATMTFRIMEDCEDGTIPVTLTYDPENVYDTNETNVVFAVQSGAVEVVSYLIGDVTGDGTVNGKDASRLRRFVGQWQDIQIVEEASDVNADGTANGKDVTRLRRYVGGWADIVLGPQSSKAAANAAVTQSLSETPTFSVSNESAKPGESVTITVSAANNPGIVAAYLNISYDLDKLTLTKVTNGTVMSDSSFSPTLNVSPYCLNWDESTKPGNNTNNGVLATMTFQIADDCPDDKLPITLTYDPENVYDTNEVNVTFAVENGSITVSSGSVCEHVFTNKPSDWVAKEATCTDAAAYYVQCDKCDAVSDTLTVSVGKPLGHDWSSWTVTTEATCTEKGEKTRTCKREGCNAKETDEIAANGHTEVIDAAVEPTCTAPGKTAGKHCSVCKEILTAQTEIPAKGHTWTAASCTTPKTCSVCSATEGEPLGHDYTVSQYDAENHWKKCIRCDEKSEITAHSFPAHSCDEKVKCTGCDYEKAAGQHSYGEYVQTKAPTCTAAGEETRTCGICSHTETRKVAALDHDFGEWTIVTAPTCTEKGEEARTCKRDGCTERETREVKALNHDFGEWTIATAPTCTEKGEEARACKREGCTERETREVAALDHDFGEWTVVTAPTCTEKGEEARACKREGCTERETRETAALGHTEGQPVRENVVPATKDAEGSYDEVIYCKTCNTELSRVEKTIPKLDDDRPVPSIRRPSAVKTLPFRDVPTSAWYYDAVMSAWKADLINGVTSTEFRPNENMTLAQAIKLAAALHQLNYRGEVTLKNGSPNWYSNYVDYAIDNGLIESAYGKYTTAQMNGAVTRAEFVHIFHEAADDLREVNTVARNAIPDVKTGDAFAAEIYDFYRAGILTGSDANGTFHPTDSIKRSEVTAILIRMYDRSVRKTITIG